MPSVERRMPSEVPAMVRFMSSLWSIQRGTQRVSAPRQRPPHRIVADDTTLTPYGGSVVLGELCRRLGLVAGLGRAIDGGTRARPPGFGQLTADRGASGATAALRRSRRWSASSLPSFSCR
jgi:hypothetical protein